MSKYNLRAGDWGWQGGWGLVPPEQSLLSVHYSCTAAVAADTAAAGIPVVDHLSNSSVAEGLERCRRSEGRRIGRVCLLAISYDCVSRSCLSGTVVYTIEECQIRHHGEHDEGGESRRWSYR